MNVEHNAQRASAQAPQPAQAAQAATNYDQLVWSAGRAALIVFTVKIVSVVILAKALGAPTKLSFWLGVVPHLAFSTDESTFRTIVTWSTISMASAALILAAVTVARTTSGDRQRLWGRLVAGIVALETLGLQLWRQRSGGTPVQWQWSWLVIVTGCAGIALLAIPLWTQRGGPTEGHSELDSKNRGGTAVQEGL